MTETASSATESGAAQPPLSIVRVTSTVGNDGQPNEIYYVAGRTVADYIIRAGRNVPVGQVLLNGNKVSTDRPVWETDLTVRSSDQGGCRLAVIVIEASSNG
jgi:hypothetical protein